MGDIGDRGDSNIAVWARLLAEKIRRPTMVHVVRGNHEDSKIGEVGDTPSTEILG